MGVGCSAAEPETLRRSHTAGTDQGDDARSVLEDVPGEPPLGETATQNDAPAGGQGSGQGGQQGFVFPGAGGAGAAPAAAAEPVGCNDIQFGVSDFGPFQPGSQLPYRGEADAEVNIFNSGYIHASLDYGALRRYADPSYCSPYEINCRSTSNTQRFRTMRVSAGLGTARVIRIALWATSRNQLRFRQVSMNTPGAVPGARDVPVGGTGPFTFELRNLLTPAVLTSIATDEINNYMITAYVPDASQRDVYRNRVCALRVNVVNKGFGS